MKLFRNGWHRLTRCSPKQSEEHTGSPNRRSENGNETEKASSRWIRANWIDNTTLLPPDLSTSDCSDHVASATLLIGQPSRTNRERCCYFFFRSVSKKHSARGMRPSSLLAALIIYCWCYSTCLGYSRRVSDITVACYFDDSHLLDSCLVAFPLADGALNVT